MTAATKALALVGAGPGLGLSIAKRFGAAGFQVALLARKPPKLTRLVAELDAHGITARAYVADVTDRPGPAATLAQLEADSGAIDVLEYSPVPASRPCPSPKPRPRASSTSSSR